MTIEATAREAPSTPADDRGIVPVAELLAALSIGTPCSAEALAAALVEMESVPPIGFRTVGAPAQYAERLAVELGRPDLRMRARLIQADVLLREGAIAESGRVGHEVHAWTLEHGDDYLVARSHYHLANFFRHAGDFADALAHAVQAVSGTGDDVPPGIRARHLCTLAITLHENGSAEEGSRRFQEALDIATTIEDPALSLQVLNNMAYTAYEADEPDEAEALATRMRGIESRYGVQLGANYLDTIARIQMMRGRYAEAEQTLRPVLDGSAGHLLTEGNALSECLLTTVDAQRLRGALAEAQATLDAARRVCEERGLASQRARVRQKQAELFAATGRYREAYEEHRGFYADAQALLSAQRDARARALQAVFETEEARRASERFREMAHRDALTGLHNRRHVNELLPALLTRATQLAAPISVALLDLDHFKRVNDTLSHETGDVVLKQVARLLAGAAEGAGDQALAARLGGEEFLLIMPDADAATAMRHCERLRRAIGSHPWEPVTGKLPVTASIGLTTVPAGQITPSALLAQADRNLYTAKRSGRDRVVGDLC
ncbi:tetratricopeptide repeat-containing diguanylate cyclase [Micromonospora pattaloongensis]|uniref:tetratricopeptide repeat-containing diguanylate cyclase n=1 Tax=Micromonospora pattaloongensis TaxID=405436 RepID=UPI001FE09609|nr:diguanylate cyclase [Micromonospora pattaloongensis]